MAKTFISFMLVFLFSCKSEKMQIHENLLEFKTTILTDLGDSNYAYFEKKVKSRNMEIEYLDDVIYVSYLDELNGCGRYNGNIEISNDTIKLFVNLISNEVCSTLRINKITFLISNLDRQKKVFIKD